jgi:hypothetical protein
MSLFPATSLMKSSARKSHHSVRKSYPFSIIYLCLRELGVYFTFGLQSAVYLAAQLASHAIARPSRLIPDP